MILAASSSVYEVNEGYMEFNVLTGSDNFCCRS